MIPRPRFGSDEALPAGTTLGKYEILRKLATGGMAELYLARVRGVAGFEKTVVLKRILPQVAADAAFVQMFLDEARLAATLQHPNIADVYDVGDVGGNPFFTMEFVHGQDVRSIRVTARKREEPVPLAIALAIAHGTAAALDYAHERVGPDGQSLELVHRDVSASNIIVSYDGAIKLLDFGIARAASHRHKTQIGALKGKTPYMSPEQCRAQRLDRRSDLFSLGIVMFELTVGRRPFRGESDFVIMEQIVHGEAPRPSSILPGYPEPLEAIVMKLLARRVEQRYQTAEALLHDLEEFIAQHQLWVSSKQLGRYMRLVFADRIEAWERASHDGVPLSLHVAETITSESQRSELVTPASAFPRLRRLSQEFPALGMPSAQMAAVTPPPAAVAPPPAEDPMFESEEATVAADEPMFESEEPTAASEDLEEDTVIPGRARRSAALPAAAAALPAAFEPPRPSAELPAAFEPPRPSAELPAAINLRPSRRPLVFAALVVLAVAAAAGAYAWPRMFPRQPPATAAAPTAADTGAPEPGGSPSPSVSPIDEPRAPAPPVAATAPTPEPAPAPEPTPEPEPETTPATTPPPPATTTAPLPPPARAAPPTAPKRAAPPRTPRAPAKRPAHDPKEKAWDRDSPFLPSS